MGMKRKKRASRRRGWLLGSSATQVICISFVLLIALGTLLLTLPISSRSGRLGVVDAMFPATSATCVTGLVVYIVARAVTADTASSAIPALSD